jgi:outer membrane autotransporter protein
VQADATGWDLRGTNTFSTNVTVETGLLSINGELDTTNVIVETNGSLGGTGTVFSIVNSHGVIAPGNSIGTLNIVGSLNMTNSTYDEQVDAAGNSDLINVSGSPGTAIISNATVVVLLTPAIYGSNTVYTNLTATGGVLGTNAGVSISNAPLFLTASLGYPDAYTVETILHRKPFVSVANTYNQHSVAGALDGIVDSPGAGMFNLVSNFFWLPTADAARAALDSMSGEIHGTLGMLDVQEQDAFNNSIALRTGRMSAGGGSGGYGSAKPVQLASAGSTLPPMQQQSEADQLLDNIWLQGFGTFGHLNGDGNASGGDFTISGLSGGLDYRLCPEMLVGVAVGYSHDDASVGGPGASGTVDAIQFAGYGGYVNGPWHLDGIFSYGYLQTDTKRFINVGSIHQEADGSYNGNVFSLSTEGGYAFEAGPVTIEPTVGLNYTHLSQDSFQETGAGPNGLNVHSVDMDSVRTALGVRLAAQFGEKDGVQFIPALRAAWEHEFMDKTADVNASFIGGSGDFVVRGVELGADSGVLGAGLTVSFNKAIQGFVNYDANLNARMSSHAISGGLSYSW